MPVVGPRLRWCPLATWRASAKITRVVPSLMSDSAFRMVMDDLGSLPLRVATAVASVGARAAPMMRATPQSVPKKKFSVQAITAAVKMTSSVPVRMMPRMNLRISRQEVLRASQKSMMGRKISRMTCGGRPSSCTSCSWWAGMRPSTSPKTMRTMAGVRRVLWAMMLPMRIARERAMRTSNKAWFSLWSCALSRLCRTVSRFNTLASG